jgi:hypothetical protein
MSPHSVTPHKTNIGIFTAVRTSNVTETLNVNVKGEVLQL